MVEKIIWNPEAQDDFREIVEYLIDNWSFEVAEKFTDDVDKVQMLIQRHTHIGVKVGRLRSVRKVVVPPFYSLYYTFLQHEVWILNILDNRRNPDKI